MQKRGSKKGKASTRNVTPESDHDHEKRRGRPRVEKEDQSAADRRRTQIRMAQRAYRQRKESALDDFRKRVSDLNNTVELMHRSFLDYCDRVRALNLSQPHQHELDAITRQMEGIVRDTRYHSAESDDNIAEALVPGTSSANFEELQVDGHDLPLARNVPSWMDPTMVVANNDRNADEMEMGMGYKLYLLGEEKALETQRYLQLQSHEEDDTIELSSQPPMDESLNAYLFQVNSPRLISQPTPLRTYSLQETTIARRIHRACVELGYSLLFERSRRPEACKQAFKLSLMSRDYAKILAAQRMVLDRGAGEDLNFWEAPLIHVGGAGTHYAPRDPSGNLLPKRQSRNIGLIGPQTLAMLENESSDNVPMDLTVEIAGLEGEWFDPYDVQGYLEEKGIFIDPRSSFAEAEILEWPQESTMTTTSTGSSGTYSVASNDSSVRANEAGPLNRHRSSFWDPDLLSAIDLPDVGFSDAQTGSFINFIPSAQSSRDSTLDSSFPIHTLPPTSEGSDLNTVEYGLNDLTAVFAPPEKQTTPIQPWTKKVIIDVSAFVRAICSEVVCMGRSPCFRRQAVDRALQKASFDAH